MKCTGNGYREMNQGMGMHEGASIDLGMKPCWLCCFLSTGHTGQCTIRIQCNAQFEQKYSRPTQASTLTLPNGRSAARRANMHSRKGSGSAIERDETLAVEKRLRGMRCWQWISD
eukprot:1124743-Pelagomonas_calceolata.AAC.8